MAMTAQVKAELANTQVTKTCCRKAEVSSMLRFADALHLVNGGIVVEAELDTGAAARRMRKDIAEVFGHQPEVVLLKGSGIRRGSRYIVRVSREGESLARQTGLIDNRNRPVRGLPPVVVNGSGCDAVAAWRGAFLAHGSLTEPGRSSSLEVTCPGPEAALALVGSARRLGISAKAREVRGVDRVVIRDGDAIGQLLTRLGAHESLLAWEERRMRREVRATANRLANFDDANLRRSARAAVAAGARVERALEILGEEIPDHLRQAGRLRLEHKQASLEELGQLSEPVLTKDAIAGPDPPAAGDGRQARRGPRHPRHGVLADPGDAGRGGLSPSAPPAEVTRSYADDPSGSIQSRDRVESRCPSPAVQETRCDRPRRHQRLRPHRPQLLPRRARLRRRHRDRRRQRPDRQQLARPPAQVRLDPRPPRRRRDRDGHQRSASATRRSRPSPSATPPPSSGATSASTSSSSRPASSPTPPRRTPTSTPARRRSSSPRPPPTRTSRS